GRRRVRAQLLPGQRLPGGATRAADQLARGDRGDAAGGEVSAAPLRIGTRASTLALTQSGQVGAALVEGTGHGVELVHVRTGGDVDRTSLLSQIGGTGVFVTAVCQALLDGEVEVSVHSCKDLHPMPRERSTPGY